MEQQIINAMAELKEDDLFPAVQRAVDEGVPGADILAALQAGLGIVGERFAAEEYYLSELMLSAELFNEASALLGDEGAVSTESLGTFLIATVETDIHDIGKNIVAAVMKSNGFAVVDLGVDVPAETVVRAIEEHRPQVVGLSCLLTTCFEKMKETITAIREKGLDEGRLILIGGAPIDDNAMRYVNADGRCPTAQDTVSMSKAFLGEAG